MRRFKPWWFLAGFMAVQAATWILILATRR